MDSTVASCCSFSLIALISGSGSASSNSFFDSTADGFNGRAGDISVDEDVSCPQTGAHRRSRESGKVRFRICMVSCSGVVIITAACNCAMSRTYQTVSVRFVAFHLRFSCRCRLEPGAILRRMTSSVNNATAECPGPRVLVVDDDPALRELLKDYLVANGFCVESVGDGAAMRASLADGFPDVIVLDLMLPGEDGLALTRMVRAQSSVPILMLSARGEEVDRVIGLEVGADDYLAKPFGPRELLARLRALLRRGQPALAMGSPMPGEFGRFGPFSLDLAGRRLLRDNVEIPLTGAEFDLLASFYASPNRVLSRDMLIDSLKGYERDPFDRSVDIRVTRLRRKIERVPSAPAYIRTVRGEGYLFNPRGGDT